MVVVINGGKEFLESSTIHGLSYIAGNRVLVRLLWVCVVITGFTGAVVLILQSFASWADSPITTTIETLPIQNPVNVIARLEPDTNNNCQDNYLSPMTSVRISTQVSMDSVFR